MVRAAPGPAHVGRARGATAARLFAQRRAGVFIVLHFLARALRKLGPLTAALEEQFHSNQIQHSGAGLPGSALD